MAYSSPTAIMPDQIAAGLKWQERQFRQRHPLPSNRHLLIVDDPDMEGSSLATHMRKAGFDVRWAASRAEAENLALQFHPGFIVLDPWLGGADGLTLIPRLLDHAPGSRLVVTTRHVSLEAATWAVRAGAIDFLAKPADADMVEKALTAVHSKSDMPEESDNPFTVRQRYICETLAYHNFNITRAAAKLGMTRRSLQRRLSLQRCNPAQAECNCLPAR